jgi:two-component system cell cycle response regulator CtrA
LLLQELPRGPSVVKEHRAEHPGMTSQPVTRVDTRYLRALQDENARLREQTAYLQDALTCGFLAPLEWRLTPQENRFLGALVARPLATRDLIMAALYHHRGADEAEMKVIDVFACKLRKKLKPHGIEIHTVWGRGYRLDAATRTRLRQCSIKLEAEEG